ncbi:Cell division cycle protein 123 [Golovinomyces cichoracearum]|uniref:Cell division cycle protein 123 n=1 Tax=Golovinomyces cichoracearum TaxID=62708 RepID=A0A420J990_9PEZI|nr:Cell division cycle protein 123 [Golovinomyces cichoracearum]
MPDMTQIVGDQSIPDFPKPDFGPISRAHILHCSYDHWHPMYRSSSIKSKIIPLPPSFINYLRSDGIILSSDSFTVSPTCFSENSNDTFITSENDSGSEPENSPLVLFPELHKKINQTIAELGGLVAPKLNWSAPKDATWISIKNSMECATADDIYLLLKSSDFITFDLEHPFDETVEKEGISNENIEYILVLRKWFPINPSSEFRCFVRNRTVIAICQRDLNYYDYLSKIKDTIRDAIMNFFKEIFRKTFPEPDFVFDIYLPEPFDRVRLIDINAWAPRTDSLLFSWQELLSLPSSENLQVSELGGGQNLISSCIDNFSEIPELRLVRKDDSEACKYGSSKYSTSKVPREVVQAGLTGEKGIKDFTDNWNRMLNGELEMQSSYDSDDEDDNLGNRTTRGRS